MPRACHRLTDWQGLILQHPPQARQGLKKLLEGRLAFTPTEDGTAVEFSGQGRLDPILAGVTEAWNGLPKGCVSPTGTDLFGLTPPLRGVVRVA